MRGVAALCVLLFHGPELVRPFSAVHGYLAVDIFFILSGFVIARTYERRLAERGVAWFLRERLIRLHPIYLAGLVLGIVVALLQFVTKANHTLSPATIGAAAVSGFFMLPSWLTDEKLKLFPLDYPAWTLFFELAINIVYAFTYRWWNVRLLAAVVALCAALLSYAAYDLGSLDHGALWNDAWCGVARVGFGFPVGVLIYKLNVSFRVPSWGSPLIVTAVAALLCASAHHVLYDLFVVFVAAPVVVVLGAQCKTPRSLCSSYEFVGEASYALYALHVPLLAICLPLLKQKVGIELDVRVGAVVLAVFVVGAFFVTRWYDAPVRRLLKAWSTRRYGDGGRRDGT